MRCLSFSNSAFLSCSSLASEGGAHVAHSLRPGAFMDWMPGCVGPESIQIGSPCSGALGGHSAGRQSHGNCAATTRSGRYFSTVWQDGPSCKHSLVKQAKRKSKAIFPPAGQAFASAWPPKSKRRSPKRPDDLSPKEPPLSVVRVATVIAAGATSQLDFWVGCLASSFPRRWVSRSIGYRHKNRIVSLRGDNPQYFPVIEH